jgi:hypothetical protein
MKNLKVLVMLFLAASLLSTGCKKDDDDTPQAPDLTGTFEVYMDNDKVGGGTSNEVGLVSATITIGQGEDISLIISSVPLSVGETLDIDGSNRTVSIMGKNLLLTDGSEELYFAIDGTITRVSNTKFSFEGTCSAFGGTTVHTFSGYAESDVYKGVE